MKSAPNAPNKAPSSMFPIGRIFARSAPGVGDERHEARRHFGARVACRARSAFGAAASLASRRWHLLADGTHPDAGGDFLVIDRGGPHASEDCEEQSLLEVEVWVQV